eukprot:TRINITY_DN35875_c0_g1_i1.p1 TRINITY_DN35875_c0_g1~~TRINITY_DN35875_c0_g1_i1.p1  ORF type:complete len:300 (-),score=73.16 TRINITY_DN35875_c0_g1_i1:69-968(-)
MGRDPRDDDEDPLGLFLSGPSEAKAACVGNWKTDENSPQNGGRNLDVKIWAKAGGGLLLEAGSKELVLKAVSFNVWSAAAASTPSVELYTARIQGFGAETRLVMRPGGRNEGSSKAAILKRIDDERHDGSVVLKGRSETNRADEEPLRRRSPGLLRSGSRSRGRGGGRSPSGSVSRSDSRRSRSRSHRRRRRRGGGGGGGGGGRRERSAPKAAGGEDITTIFVSGLPEDASESEVRTDFERDGSVVHRIVLMKRTNEMSAFIRFGTVDEALRAQDKILDGKLRICDSKVKAELARRNTN